MPLKPAKCPQCGAQLKVNSEQDAAICEYCNTPFIVEKAINNFNITNNFEGANVVIQEADITSVEKLKKLAWQAYLDNNFSDAYEFYRNILLRDPDDIEAYFFSQYCRIYSQLENAPVSEVEIFKKVVPTTILRIFRSNMDNADKVTFTTRIIDICRILRIDFRRAVERKENMNNNKVKLDPNKVANQVVLRMADTLYDCYPNDKYYQDYYLPIWKEIVEDPDADSTLQNIYEKKIKQIDKNYVNGTAKVMLYAGIIFFVIGGIGLLFSDDKTIGQKLSLYALGLGAWGCVYGIYKITKGHIFNRG